MIGHNHAPKIVFSTGHANFKYCLSTPIMGTSEFASEFALPKLLAGCIPPQHIASNCIPPVRACSCAMPKLESVTLSK